MPEIVHCRKCGKAIRVEDFADMMKKLRRHYKEKHPRAFKESISRGVKKRRAKRMAKGK